MTEIRASAIKAVHAGAGSPDSTQRASRELADAAAGEFETAFAGTRDQEAKQFVRSILDYVVERAA